MDFPARILVSYLPPRRDFFKFFVFSKRQSPKRPNFIELPLRIIPKSSYLLPSSVTSILDEFNQTGPEGPVPAKLLPHLHGPKFTSTQNQHRLRPAVYKLPGPDHLHTGQFAKAREFRKVLSLQLQHYNIKRIQIQVSWGKTCMGQSLRGIQWSFRSSPPPTLESWMALPPTTCDVWQYRRSTAN